MRKLRNHGRTNKPLTTKFRIHSNSSYENVGKWDMVLLRDLSIGGLKFFAGSEVKVGSIFDLDIKIPNRKNKSVTCRGMALRVDTFTSTDLCQVAGCFIDLDEKDLNEIKGLV